MSSHQRTGPQSQGPSQWISRRLLFLQKVTGIAYCLILLWCFRSQVSVYFTAWHVENEVGLLWRQMTGDTTSDRTGTLWSVKTVWPCPVYYTLVSYSTCHSNAKWHSSKASRKTNELAHGTGQRLAHKQGHTVQPWMAWKYLYRSGWECQTQKSTARIKACVTMLNATVQVFFLWSHWNCFAQHLQPQVGVTDTESRFSQTWKKALVNHN